tara:strand:- start:400 stop:921 length:522 start_codon:yes stop_codon:yes gene_type:complete
MIDDQFAPSMPKILEAVGKIAEELIRFVLNTHWHFDHTGGNENLGKAGLAIVAQDNVRKLISADQFLRAFGNKDSSSTGAGVIGGLAEAAFEKDLDHLSHRQEMAVFRSLFHPSEGFGNGFLDAEPFCIIADHIKHRDGGAESRRFVDLRHRFHIPCHRMPSHHSEDERGLLI